MAVEQESSGGAAVEQESSGGAGERRGSRRAPVEQESGGGAAVEQESGGGAGERRWRWVVEERSWGGGGGRERGEEECIMQFWSIILIRVVREKSGKNFGYGKVSEKSGNFVMNAHDIF